MDLSLLKKFFLAAGEVQAQLRQRWTLFRLDNTFALYKAIATRSQPRINAEMLRQFIKSFNWEVSSITSKDAHPHADFQVKSLVPDLSAEKALDLGIQLLLKQWGNGEALDFHMFCLLVRGQEDNPGVSQKQLPFPSKKNLFDTLMAEINGLLKIQAFKKAVFHQYRNKTDLFEILTPNSTFDQEQLNMLFLSLSDRKQKQEIVDMSMRVKLPWDFNQFLDTFKCAANRNNQKQYKIHYSSKRNKGEDGTPNPKAYTTPRKSKAVYGQSSTKLTKGEVIDDLIQSSREVSEFSFKSEEKGMLNNYVDILGDILQLEEDFIKQTTTLVKCGDFDLQLVYEHHGKKFQQILNERYGVCNFSAFVRFIVPRDFDHRYLSFIRCQANNTLTSTTQAMLEDLLISYDKKQRKIKQLWGECDLELLQRAFCKPSESNMKTDKLREYFTKRETQILKNRLDPCNKGFIQISDLR